MKHLFRILTALFLTLSLASCSKDSPTNNYSTPVDPTVAYKVTLSGTNEVPTNASTAMGTGYIII